MSKIQLVVRAGIEPGTFNSKSGVLTTRPRGLPVVFGVKIIVCFFFPLFLRLYEKPSKGAKGQEIDL